MLKINVYGKNRTRTPERQPSALTPGLQLELLPAKLRFHRSVYFYFGGHFQGYPRPLLPREASVETGLGQAGHAPLTHNTSSFRDMR